MVAVSGLAANPVAAALLVGLVLALVLWVASGP